MKTKILSLFTIAIASLLSFSSCDEEWTPAEKEGQLSLSSIGVEVEGDMEVVSRADYDISTFIVKVFGSDGNLVEKWTYSDMPEIVSLPVGDYRVEIVSHELQKAEWEKPYYAGSKEFSIENNKITQIGVITCKFASLKVTVKFSEELYRAMGDDVIVTVESNDAGRLEFAKNETRSGYFAVVDGSTTLSAIFTGTVNGYKENFTKVLDDIKAGQHRIITFSLKNDNPTPPGEAGTVNPGEGVNVDVSIANESVSGGLDVDEDTETNPTRPGQEDFKDPTDPDQPGTDEPETPAETIFIEAEALQFEPVKNDLSVTNGKVTIKANDGVAHLTVEIKSTNDGFISAVAQFNIASFDLAYPVDDKQSEALAGFGFPVGDAVIGKTEVLFDISQFIGMLGGFSGEHNFVLTVTDSKDKVLSKTLTFVAP